MEIQDALQIMRALADGVSPETGEVLTSEVVHQYAPVVRAFHRAVGVLEILEERERSRRPAVNAGKSWSRAEDNQVCEEMSRGVDVHQIAATHSRTVNAVITRLVRLKKIGPDTALDVFGAMAA
jgi:hypothetical protein